MIVPTYYARGACAGNQPRSPPDLFSGAERGAVRGV